MHTVARLTAFTMTMLIVDLVLCCFRVPVVGLTILAMLADSKAMAVFGKSAVLEVVSGIGIVAFGILGNALLLARKRVGLTLCWISVGYFALSIVTSVWQIGLQAQAMHNDAEVLGVVLVGGLILAFRLGLGGLYVVALVQAQKALGSPIAAEFA
jgi:hypothetical protein